MSRWALATLAALALASASRAEPTPQQEAFPGHAVARPSAPPVTAENLLASERFWPFRVGLTRGWQPEGSGKPLPAGSVGVLIRVEEPGSARIDFGRDGLQTVPVGETDLLENANRIRRGELEKEAPNFVYAIAPRLGDSTAAKPRLFPIADTASRRSFLCVFADPDAQEFPAIARSLAPLGERSDLLTILFPQRRHADTAVRDRLRVLDWKAAFVFAHLSEPYTRIHRSGEAPLPAILLLSGEGRVLLEAPWKPSLVDAIVAVADAAPGTAPPRKQALSSPPTSRPPTE